MMGIEGDMNVFPSTPVLRRASPICFVGSSEAARISRYDALALSTPR